MGSFFEDCERDEHGRCKPGSGGGSSSGDGGGSSGGSSNDSGGSSGSGSGDSDKPISAEPPKSGASLSAVEKLVSGVKEHWEKAKALVGLMHESVYSVAVLATPTIMKVLPDILDTPDDLNKFGYNPTGFSGHGGQTHTDPIRDATGISAHMAASIASVVLAKAVLWARDKIRGKKSDDSDDEDDKNDEDLNKGAKWLAKMFDAANKHMGIKRKHDWKAIKIRIERWKEENKSDKSVRISVLKEGTEKVSTYTLESLIKSISSRSPGLGEGISFAAPYIQTMLDNVGGIRGMAGLLTNVSPESVRESLKRSEGKLVYRGAGTIVTAGTMRHENNSVRLFGKSDRKDEDRGDLTSKSIMEFENILTTADEDRDGDELDPMGADLDMSMPLLWQHDPNIPLGKMIKLLDQNKHYIKVLSGIADTLAGHDAAVLVEYGALRISHGFTPIEFRPKNDGNPNDETKGWKIFKYKVMEESLVSIPANVGAIITAVSRGKLHSPMIKKYGESLYNSRPAIVKSGWEDPKKFKKHRPIVVNVNVGDQMKNGTAPATKENEKCKCKCGGKSNEPIDLKLGYTYKHNGEAVTIIEFKDGETARVIKRNGGEIVDVKKSELTLWIVPRKSKSGKPASSKGGKVKGGGKDTHSDGDSTTDEGEDERGEDEEEEEQDEKDGEEGDEGDGKNDENEASPKAIRELSDQIHQLSKTEGLPREVGHRLALVAGIIDDVSDGMAEAGKQMADAGKTMDLVGLAKIHKEMLETHIPAIRRALEEVRRIDGSKGIPDGVGEQIKDVASSLDLVVNSLSELTGEDPSDPTDGADRDDVEKSDGTWECEACGYTDNSIEEDEKCRNCDYMPQSDDEGNTDMDDGETDDDEDKDDDIEFDTDDESDDEKEEEGEEEEEDGNAKEGDDDGDADEDDDESEDNETDKKDWKCPFCGTVNSDTDIRCTSCKKDRPVTEEKSEDDDESDSDDTDTEQKGDMNGAIDPEEENPGVADATEDGKSFDLADILDIESV